MAKLNQIIAIEKGIKSRVKSEVTELYKQAQKPDLFSGFSKQYEKVNEESEDLPAERKKVQVAAPSLLKGVSKLMSELLDVTARKDWANCGAVADVVVGGAALIKSAPVTYLLFLEKELTDVRTFVSHLPVLDDSEDWSDDPNSGLYRSEAIRTHRTKKIPKAVVLYPATPEHPAQTQMVAEDILAGHWVTVKHSGALAKPEKDDLLTKIEALLNAVKQAREQANSVDEVVPAPSIGREVFNYLFA